MDLRTIQIRLPGRRIDWHPVVDSTMILAAELARSGCASGTVVGADGTDCGCRPAGAHVAFAGRERTLRVDRTALAPGEGARFLWSCLRLGLAAKQAIESLTSLACDLRWPNDVLIKGVSNARGFWRTGKARCDRQAGIVGSM